MSPYHQSLILIGMPGAGKSTLGLLLAKNLAKDFVDTDLLIQLEYRKTLQDILHEKGYLALREAEEEIGIDGSHVDVVGNLTDLFISVSNFIVTPVIGFMDKSPQFKPDPVEVETISEADLFDIISPLKRREGTILARGKYKIQTPYFTIDDRIVWGATAMMLSEIKDVLKQLM